MFALIGQNPASFFWLKKDYIVQYVKGKDCVCPTSLVIMQCAIYTPPTFHPTAFGQQINFNSQSSFTIPARFRLCVTYMGYISMATVEKCSPLIKHFHISSR